MSQTSGTGLSLYDVTAPIGASGQARGSRVTGIRLKGDVVSW